MIVFVEGDKLKTKKLSAAWKLPKRAGQKLIDMGLARKSEFQYSSGNDLFVDLFPGCELEILDTQIFDSVDVIGEVKVALTAIDILDIRVDWVEPDEFEYIRTKETEFEIGF